jgi:hypothetical protein
MTRTGIPTSEKRKVERRRSRATLLRRLKALAERDGQDSIWAEMAWELELKIRRERKDRHEQS